MPPKISVRGMAITKNGPKAIWLLKPAFLPKISMIPRAAPVKKAKNNQINESFRPIMSPPKTANLTSPSPMPRPFVTMWMMSKRVADKNPANK